MIRQRALGAMRGLLAGGLLCCPGMLRADTITVNATDVIYAAGTQSGDTSGTGGTVPAGIPLVAGTTSVMFSSVTGSIAYDTTLNGSAPCRSLEGCIMLDFDTGNVLNDPDGNYGAATTSYVTGPVGSISGITGPGDGYLVGVFLAPGGPSGTAPAALSFTASGGTSFTSLSPLLDQVFFIGDGLTGDGTGSEQVFDAPGGATELLLGISDACGYQGTSPSCYGDNVGSYTVDYSLSGDPAPVPEPSTMILTPLALLPLGVLYWRRRIRSRLRISPETR